MGARWEPAATEEPHASSEAQRPNAESSRRCCAREGPGDWQKASSTSGGGDLLSFFRKMSPGLPWSESHLQPRKRSRAMRNAAGLAPGDCYLLPSPTNRTFPSFLLVLSFRAGRDEGDNDSKHEAEGCANAKATIDVVMEG